MEDFSLRVLSSPLLQSQRKLALLKEGVEAHGRFCKCPLSSSSTPCTSVLTHIQAFHGNDVSADTDKQKCPRIRARLAKRGFTDRGSRTRGATLICCHPQTFLGLSLVLQKSLSFVHSCEISFILGSISQHLNDVSCVTAEGWGACPLMVRRSQRAD